MTSPLTGFDDNALIRLAVEGRAECFSVLMDRYQGALKRCVFSMIRNRDDAEDVVQDVLLKVLRNLPTFRAESSFRTWMTRVAINEVSQFYRRQKVRPITLPPVDLDSFQSPSMSPHGSLDSDETIRKLRRAVAGLPEIHRQILVLRDLNELSSRETAQCLDLTVRAVKSRLFRARLMLLAALLSGRSPKSLAECRRLLGNPRACIPFKVAA